MTDTHFTAWLVNDTSALDQDYADLTVIEDEAISYREDDEGNETPVWASHGQQMFYAVTTVDARDGDMDEAMDEAKTLLGANGWETVGKWDAVDTGCTIEVRRTDSTI